MQMLCLGQKGRKNSKIWKMVGQRETQGFKEGGLSAGKEQLSSLKFPVTQESGVRA